MPTDGLAHTLQAKRIINTIGNKVRENLLYMRIKRSIREFRSIPENTPTPSVRLHNNIL